MEQKNHKEIARIIEKFEFDFEGTDQSNRDKLCNKLADYFEKPKTGKRIKVVLGKNTNSEFNREQFLKDCGVQ